MREITIQAMLDVIKRERDGAAQRCLEIAEKIDGSQDRAEIEALHERLTGVLWADAALTNCLDACERIAAAAAPKEAR